MRQNIGLSLFVVMLIGLVWLVMQMNDVNEEWRAGLTPEKIGVLEAKMTELKNLSASVMGRQVVAFVEYNDGRFALVKHVAGEDIELQNYVFDGRNVKMQIDLRFADSVKRVVKKDDPDFKECAAAFVSRF